MSPQEIAAAEAVKAATSKPLLAFALTTQNHLSGELVRELHTQWKQAVEGTDLELSRLIVLSGGMRLCPLSPEAAEHFHLAGQALRERGLTEAADWFDKMTGGPHVNGN